MMRDRIVRSLLGLVLACAGCGDDFSTTSSETSGSVGGGAGVGGGSGVGGMSAGAGGLTTGVGGAGGSMTFGDPINAPLNSWSWIPFDDAFCANGSTTGLAINPSSNSELVFIFMLGGAGCWDETSCYQDKVAPFVESGFGENDLLGFTGLMNAGPFDRSSSENPFQQASYVFVPYCTGDMHVGNATPTHGDKPTMHVGYSNMGAFLNRVVPTFPNANKVVLAGRFGATFNFQRAATWFAPARVDLINDSGPLLPSPYLSPTLEASFRDAWQLDSNLPSNCPACLNDLDALHGYLAASYPNSRGAFLSYADDTVNRFYFGLTAADYQQAVSQLRQTHFLPHDNLHSFTLAGSGHGLISPAWSNLSVSGVSLRDWVGLMIGDDAGWGSLP